MPNIDMKKAGIAAVLLFAAYKGLGQKQIVNQALAAVGAVMLAKQLPVVGPLV